MRVLVFTGAGVSRQSGLKTYRDSDGLWNGFQVEDVCSLQAYSEHTQRVLDFYNDLRTEVLAAQPNSAHLAIAALEADHEVTVVTQNVDDLHERAGSSKVLHLHGLITQKRSDAPGDREMTPCPDPIQLGDTAPNGRQYRPDVVFFGENLPPEFETAMSLTRSTDVLVVVGTSLSVGPANQVALKTKAREIYVVDPQPVSLPYGWTLSTTKTLHRYQTTATAGMARVTESLAQLGPQTEQKSVRLSN